LSLFVITMNDQNPEEPRQSILGPLAPKQPPEEVSFKSGCWTILSFLMMLGAFLFMIWLAMRYAHSVGEKIWGQIY
jgi:hypothetical protein